MADSRQLFEVFRPSGARKSRPKDQRETRRRRSGKATRVNVQTDGERREVQVHATTAVKAGPISEKSAVREPANAAADLILSDPPVPSSRWMSAGSALSGRAHTITLKFEEAAVYGVGTVILTVLAFLIGRYGSHEDAAAVPRQPVTVRVAQGEDEPPGEPLLQRDGARLGGSLAFPSANGHARRAAAPREESVRSNHTVQAPERDAYTIWVVRYKTSERAVAELQKKRLAARGFKDVRIAFDARQTRRRGYWVFVGSYAAPDDPRAQAAIRRLQNSFSSAEIKKLPSFAR